MIFIDANFWIALFNKKDACHKQALHLFNALQQSGFNKLFINNLVLAEVLTILSQRTGKVLALQFYDSLLLSFLIEIVYITESIERRAMEYFRQISTKNISFTDCSIFATSDMHQIKNIISFDKHLKCVKDFNIINDPKQLSKN
ncbi:MAG: type II toxin-antitoxin system VapC family toxin [Patescibacteria group bacterium]